MEEKPADLTVEPINDGVIILGSEDELAQLDDRPGLTVGTVDLSKLASRFSSAVALDAGLQATSGRWLKLTDESAKFLRTHGVTDVHSGVVTLGDMAGGKGSQVAKWLRFQPVALNANVLAMLAVYAQQKSIEHSLNEIKEYLEKVDQKLDALLRARDSDLKNRLDSVAMQIEKAERIVKETGHVSGTTWSSIDQCSIELDFLQKQILDRLGSIADSIRTCKQGSSGLSEQLKEAHQGVAYWLGLLAMTIDLRDRHSLLELGHVIDEYPDDLEGHRKGILDDRRKRLDALESTLTGIPSVIVNASSLGDFTQLARHERSSSIVDHANGILDDLEQFATYTEISLVEAEEITLKTRREAAEAISQSSKAWVSGKVRSAGQTVVEGATRVSDALRSSKDHVESADDANSEKSGELKGIARQKWEHGRNVVSAGTKKLLEKAPKKSPKPQIEQHEDPIEPQDVSIEEEQDG